jgi:hypothetical protein
MKFLAVSAIALGLGLFAMTPSQAIPLAPPGTAPPATP